MAEKNPWHTDVFHPAPTGWRLVYAAPFEADDRGEPVEVPMPGWVTQRNDRTGARRTVPAVHGPEKAIVPADYDPGFPVVDVLAPGEEISKLHRILARAATA